MRVPLIIAAALVGALPAEASTLYWSLFNVEEENTLTAQYVTYAELPDMLTDTNRLGVFNPGSFGRNVVGSGSDGSLYWSLFNIEDETALTAQYVTYSDLPDMLADTNRLGVFNPGSFGRNVVGSGSDGSMYWSLFNIEGETALTAQYVTYARLPDMLADTNRLGVFNPGSFGRNIVGSGADGSHYWSLFNIEDEATLTAQYVTYARLSDMLTDTNRLGVFNPGSFGRNVVGSGASLSSPTVVPLPAGIWLLGAGYLFLAGFGMRRSA